MQIIVHRPFAARSRSVVNPLPLLSAKFVFDDYIRCMSARQRLQRRGATLRHRKMTTLANLLELPVMAAPPSHFYSLTPYNTGTHGYVWSPSNRSYTSRSEENSSGKSSPKGGALSPPRKASQKFLPLSPKHSEILEKQIGASKKKRQPEKPDDESFQTMSPDAYSKPISLDTPPPRSEKLQRTQAESLASALGAKFGTDEIAAEELNTDCYNELSVRAGRRLTVDEGEEIGEDCTDGTEDSDTFYDCKGDVSASHSNLIQGIDRVKITQTKNRPVKSAPSTPTGSRKAGILRLFKFSSKDDSVNEAVSLPAIALNFSEKTTVKRTASQKTKQASDAKVSQKPRPARPSRPNRTRSKK